MTPETISVIAASISVVLAAVSKIGLYLHDEEMEELEILSSMGLEDKESIGNLEKIISSNRSKVEKRTVSSISGIVNKPKNKGGVIQITVGNGKVKRIKIRSLIQENEDSSTQKLTPGTSENSSNDI